LNPGQMRRQNWQSDALTTRLDLIRHSFVPYLIPPSFLFSPVPLSLMHPLYYTLFGLQVGKKPPFQFTCTCREIWVVMGGGEGGLSLNGDSPVLDIQPVPAHRSTCFRSATQGIRIDSPGVYFFSQINMRYYLVQ
jgi:hypothetical protein